MMTPTDIRTTIRAERKAQGLQQDELSAAANVGVCFLIKLEVGKETAQPGKKLAYDQEVCGLVEWYGCWAGS